MGLERLRGNKRGFLESFSFQIKQIVALLVGNLALRLYV